MRRAGELVSAAHAAYHGPRPAEEGPHRVGRDGHHGHGARALGHVPLDGQPLRAFQARHDAAAVVIIAAVKS